MRFQVPLRADDGPVSLAEKRAAAQQRPLFRCGSISSPRIAVSPGNPLLTLQDGRPPPARTDFPVGASKGTQVRNFTTASQSL